MRVRRTAAQFVFCFQLVRAQVHWHICMHLHCYSVFQYRDEKGFQSHFHCAFSCHPLESQGPRGSSLLVFWWMPLPFSVSLRRLPHHLQEADHHIFLARRASCHEVCPVPLSRPLRHRSIQLYSVVKPELASSFLSRLLDPSACSTRTCLDTM